MRSISQCHRVAVIDDFEQTIPVDAESIDLIELRLDRCQSSDPSQLQSQAANARKTYGTTCPFIGTLRHSSEYGAWNADETRRLECYLTLLPKIDYVDVEANAQIARPLAQKALDAHKTLIVSWHGALKNCDCARLFALAEELGASYCKIACQTDTLEDVFKLARMLAERAQYATPKPVFMGIGDAGFLTRVLFPCIGSEMVYGFGGTNAVILGQISLDTINRCFAVLKKGVNLNNLIEAMQILQHSQTYKDAIDWQDFEQTLNKHAAQWDLR